MKQLKNGLYLILLTAAGVAYLSFVDNWQIYATPLAEAKIWYQRTVQGEPVFSDSVVGQDQNFEEGFGAGEDPAVGNEPVEEKDPAAGKEPGAGEGPTMGETLSEGEDQTGGGEPNVGTDSTLDEPDSASQAGDGQADSTEGEMPEDGADISDEGEAGSSDGSAPVYMTVEDDYFADAVFIGDSRTVGLYEYGGLEEISTFYASKGLTIYKLFSAEIVKVPGERKKKTIEEALGENQFKKIYLMVGINEMGTGTVETFAKAYKEAVEHLLELQPDAIIYIQGILKVTTERSGQGDYINNEGITARNEAIAQLADNSRIFYLDVNPLLCDASGGLESSYTSDGVHLKAQYISIWKNYLKEHAVE